MASKNRSSMFENIMSFKIFGLFKYTEENCANEIIKILKKIQPNSNPIYEPQKSQVRDTKEGSAVYLGNIINHVKTLAKKDRLNYLESFLSTALKTNDVSYEASADQLIPRLKSKTEIAIRELNIKSLDAKPSLWSTYAFTDSFIWELGLDSSSAISIVTVETLEKLSLSKDEAMAIAKKNLFSISNNSFFEEVNEGLFISKYDDDHDAARILLTDAISSLKVKGQPVAFVPAAKVLLICGSEDTNLLNNIHSYIDSLTEGVRPLSRRPLVLIDDNWQNFVPDKSEQYAGVHNQIKIEELSAYEEQKALLNSINESSNLDIFVSSYQLFQNKESLHYLSTTTWSEGVHSWLPRTETISFVNFENEQAKFVGQMRFDEALLNFSDLMTPLGYTPERYEVKGYPNKDQLQKLLMNSQG